MEDIILIGGGGHCRSVLDSIRSGGLYNAVGIVDFKDKKGSLMDGLEVIGSDEDLEKLYEGGIKYAFITLGSVGSPQKRRGLYKLVKNIGYAIPAVIDKSAILADSVSIGEGSYIGKGAILNSNVTVGDMAIINTGAVIDHDCSIGDFAHIATGASMSGGVTIESDVHIGTGASVIQEIKIGEGSLIGAGAVVVRSIGKRKKAYGNPCREVGNIE